MTTIIAELAIYGNNLKPNQVTSWLGIELTKTWLPGDVKNHRTNAIYDYGCWKTCTEESSSSLEEHVQILMLKTDRCLSLISKFSNEHDFEIELSVVLKMSEISPDISLSNCALEWMCKLGASLDIDMYTYTSA